MNLTGSKKEVIHLEKQIMNQAEYACNLKIEDRNTFHLYKVYAFYYLVYFF